MWCIIWTRWSFAHTSTISASESALGMSRLSKVVLFANQPRHARQNDSFKSQVWMRAMFVNVYESQLPQSTHSSGASQIETVCLLFVFETIWPGGHSQLTCQTSTSRHQVSMWRVWRVVHAENEFEHSFQRSASQDSAQMHVLYVKLLGERQVGRARSKETSRTTNSTCCSAKGHSMLGMFGSVLFVYLNAGAHSRKACNCSIVSVKWKFLVSSCC